MVWLGEHRRHRPALDDAPGIHHRHAVAGRGDDTEIVRHQHHRHAEPVSQAENEFQDLILDGDVERRRRLVRQQQFRSARQRDGDHRPLPHAARKLVRIVPEPPRRLGDADHLQQFQRPQGTPAPVEAGVGAQVFLDLQADRQHRIEGGHRLLEDHRDLPAADRPQLELGHRHQLSPAPAYRPRDPPRRVDQPMWRSQATARLRPSFLIAPSSGRWPSR